jgi:uncharacterized repeat protein (TIGR04076 family)
MDNKPNLNLNLNSPRTYDEYKRHWSNLYRLEIKLTDKIGECKHGQGDVFHYDNPYKRPEDVCFALLHVLDLYVWRVILGFPSWREKTRGVYRIHCPDHTGAIWDRFEFPAIIRHGGGYGACFAGYHV